MKLCGIELKSNNAIVSVIEIIDDETSYINTKIKKFILEDDEKKDSLIRFKNEIE
jgi:hypothetical protein